MRRARSPRAPRSARPSARRPRRARADRLDQRPPRRLGGLLERHEAAPLEARSVAWSAPASARDAPPRWPARRPAPRARRAGARRAAAPSPSSAARARVRERGPQRASRHQRPTRAGARCRAAAPAPARARAWSTYSSATHSPSRTSSAGTSVSSADSGSTSRSAGTSLVAGQVHHDAEQPPAPERDDQHAAHADAAQPRAQQVVERPAQGARRGQRLDLGDHRPDATSTAGWQRPARHQRGRRGVSPRLSSPGARAPDPREDWLALPAPPDLEQVGDHHVLVAELQVVGVGQLLHVLRCARGCARTGRSPRRTSSPPPSASKPCSRAARPCAPGSGSRAASGRRPRPRRAPPGACVIRWSSRLRPQ